MDYKIRKIVTITSLVMICSIIGGIFLLQYFADLNKESSPNTVVQDTKIDVLSGQIGDDLYAYLGDDTFFNQEESMLEQLLTQSQKLVLDIISVEQNLRIKLNDYRGNLITGSEFSVSIGNGTSYADKDKDGIIEIPNLAEGEYEVTLLPLDGYIVPTQSQVVWVKGQVDYKPIDDISLFVLAEEDVIVWTDESNFNAASQTASETQITTIEDIVSKNTVGISISSQNESVDWNALYEAGVDFVMLRVGYRGNTSAMIIADGKFQEYAADAIKAGLMVGVYFESQAVTQVEAVEEASFVLEAIQGFYIPYPVIIDMQGAGQEGRNESLSESERTNIVIAFSETIASGGYSSGMYAAGYQLEQSYDVALLDNYYIWMGEYNKIPTYSNYYNIWQITASGIVPGVLENVKINISY